jgi:hypothetical protein
MLNINDNMWREASVPITGGPAWSTQGKFVFFIFKVISIFSSVTLLDV